MHDVICVMGYLIVPGTQLPQNPHFLLALTALIWSGNAIAGRFAVGHISPMVLTACRWGLALFLVSLLARRHLKTDWSKIKQNWLYLLLMGGIGYTGFNFFLYSALQHTSAINVTLEQTAMPMLVFLFSYICFRVPISAFHIIGYALTLIGVLVVVSNGDPAGFFSGRSMTLNRGDVMMLGAALAYSGYSTALRLKPDLHWLSFLWALVAAALVFSVFGVIFEEWAGQTIYPVTLQGVAVATFAGIFPSLIAQGLFIVGVERLGANAAAIYINLVPVFGAILAVTILGEGVYLFHAVAFILVAGGVMLAQQANR